MRIQLEDANLSYAHLDGAGLTAVGFSDTTQLKDTTFVGALVRKQDLERAVGLTQPQIESMYFVDMKILLETIKDDEPMKRKLERVIAEATQG